MRQALICAFAITQAVLYSSLMPLWEGFDEPWHYGYVQYLASTPGLPVLGQTALSKELWNNILNTPVSHVVQHAWPELQTFEQARAGEPHTAGDPDAVHSNYEIQQPPLAYALLAPIGFVLQNAQMPVRILWLRIFNALLCAAGTFTGVLYLLKSLGLSDRLQQLGLFCIFACQVYWAVTVHIANDGIALVLTIWYFAAIADGTRPTRLAIVTALGLVAKAYFLPLAVYAFFFIGWKRTALVLAIAGPWYTRNLFRYHNLSGLLMANIPIREALAALTKVPWTHTIPYMLRATLWTGNNSFTTFSTLTLNALITLIAVSCLVGRVANPRPIVNRPKLLGALAIFTAAVIYVAANDVILLHGTSAGPAPWYTLPLLPPIIAIALQGANRTRLLQIGFVLLSAYICIATYAVKLIPLYGGYPEGRSTLAGLWHWYTTTGPQLIFSLAPPTAIYLETAAVTGLAITLAAKLC